MELSKSIRNIAWVAVALASFGAADAWALTVEFRGTNHKVLEYAPDNRSGLEGLYVAYDTAEITEMAIGGFSSGATVSRYSNLGGGYAEPVTSSYDGSNIVVSNPAGNSGYIVTENGRNTCFWIVNYASQRMTLTAVGVDSQQDCDNTRFTINGNAPEIHYYTIDGRPVVLSRDIEMVYYTQVWDEETPGFVTEQTTRTLPNLTNPLTITPPLYCATDVTVRGDRFLEAWGMPVSVTSATIQPNGLACHTISEQTNLPEEDEAGSNMISGGGSEGELGGSAPADIRFSAYTTEAVIHNEWQISHDPEFGTVDYRFNEKEIEYTFQEEGTFYVRFIGSNSDGTCETFGDTYTVGIGASELRIPNAFTPNDDGVNDVWKVGYRSLLGFKCWIFDRYGNEIFYFDNPAEGWDGTYKGKKVKSGVYYYVIEATGSDGKKYKKGGDINILGYKHLDGTTAPVE